LSSSFLIFKACSIEDSTKFESGFLLAFSFYFFAFMPSRIAVSIGFSSVTLSFFDLLEDDMADTIFSSTS